MTILQAASNGWCVGAQGLFFVMNIVLASVYSNYKRGLDLRASQFQDARHKSLDIAYDILTKHNLHHAKREVSHDRNNNNSSRWAVCCQSDGAVFCGAGPAGAGLPRAGA